MVTEKGMGIHFKLTDVPFGSRATIGVKGIKLDDEDKVVSLIVLKDTVNYIGFAYADGSGKKVKVEEFPVQGRAGKGVQAAKDKEIIGAVGLTDEDNVLICTSSKGICIESKDIPTLGRQAIGNKLIKEGQIISIARV